MRTIETRYFYASVKEGLIGLPSVLGAVFTFVAVLINAWSFAQITDPATQCTSGCTSNDVQIKTAYLSTQSGTKLDNSFVCPASGTATVYLTLELTTNTPRVGVSIFTRIKTYVGGVVGSELTGSPVSECFGIALNQPTNKVTFQSPFSWPCGTPIVMTNVYLAWGTGNTNFCVVADGPFKCPATPSKCFQLPPTNFIAIQTPTPQVATLTKCEESSGSGTAHFNFTQADATIANGQNVIISGWYTGYNSGTNTFSGLIIDSTNHSSGSATIYAQVCDATHTTVCSPGTLTLVVNSRPAAAAAGDLITCNNTTATLNGSGSATSGVTYLWSGSNSISNGTSISATTTSGGTYTLLVTNSTTGCTASATASVSVNQTSPTAIAAGNTITCTNTSVSISGTGSTSSGATYSWSGPGIVSGGTTLSPTVNAGGTYTLIVTRTDNGCTASATASVSVNQSAPTAVASAPNKITCTNTSVSISGTGSTSSGATYSWSGPGIVSGGTTLSPTVNAGGTYTLTVTRTDNGCTASATASVSVNQSAPTAVASAPNVITCTNTSVGISGSGSTSSGATYSWSGPGIVSGGTTLNPTVNAGGTYTLIVTRTDNGCTASATASVSVNQSTPTAVASAPNVITCTNTSVGISGSGSTSSGATYSWSGPGIVSGGTTLSPTVNAGGIYTLTVTRTDNGCTASATASVSLNTTAPTFTITAVQPTLCTQYGSLTITPTVPGSYHFSIDNGSTFPNTTGSYPTLASGSVTGIKIKNDANGCISSALACGTTNLPTETLRTSPTGDMTVLAQVPTVKAYPNPFNDHVKFVINAPAAGNGSLDIYNVMGQKVKAVYQGRIMAGNNSFELVIPKKDQETLIYVFRVGDQKVTGKLLQLNR